MHIVNNTSGISGIAGKGHQAITVHSWPLDEAIGVQLSPLFPVVTAKHTRLFVSLNLMDKWTAMVTIMQKFNEPLHGRSRS